MPAESDITSQTIELPADLHMSGLQSLQETLVEHVDAEAPLTIDGAAVERVSTGAVQLLVAFFRDRTAQARSTQWAQVSDALREAINWLGLNQHLALPTQQQTQ